MNTDNLKAASEFDAIAKKQGWNLSSIARVMSDFIFMEGLWPKAAAYAQQRADEENEEGN